MVLTVTLYRPLVDSVAIPGSTVPTSVRRARSPHSASPQPHTRPCRIQVEVVVGTYVSRTDDRSVPLFHEDVVSVCESVRASSISDPLLALLELLKQPE